MEENEEIESDKKDPNCLKITLIGDSGVGKTCIINRYAQNEFTENTDSTLGVGYKKKAFEFNGKTYQLDLWDTAGQEQYRSLGKHFYKDSFIVILVYDITSRESFDNLKSVWIEDVINFGEKNKVLAIVGSKKDLYEDNEAVTYQDGENLAKEYDAVFMEVSSKNGTNINLLFETCVKKYLDPNFQVVIEEDIKKNEDSKVIRKKNHKKKKEADKKKCC